jgi:hypothetical protein
MAKKESKGPFAVSLANTLWATTSRMSNRILSPTRLTQQHRREANDGSSAPTVAIPKPDRVCRGCGKRIRAEHNDCGKCAIEGATKRLIETARIGRIAAHTPEALAKEGKSQRQHAKARSSWAASSHPVWLTPKTYFESISAATCRSFNLSYCCTDRCVSLVRRKTSPGLPTASTALAGAGGTGGGAAHLGSAESGV